MTAPAVDAAPATRPAPLPRLGFVGVGWIGRHRMLALQRAGVAEIAAIADPVAASREAAAAAVGGEVEVADDLEAILELPLDGVVIATPSALHAEQCLDALDRGLAVFCQKPLGRNARETRRVVDRAREMDRLLGVDLSYRHTVAMQKIREQVAAGALGKVFAANLVFHNAYGPDKPWFYDKVSAGGGCVMDLGIHLVDLALWLLDFPDVVSVHSHVLGAGEPIDTAGYKVEDYASVQLELDGGVAIQLACSWNLPAGRDAVIEAAFYGTHGGAAMRNVDGSFLDFSAELFSGTRAERLAEPPDDWGGRALVQWAERLARSGRFDPAAEELVEVAEVLDAIYGRSGKS